MHHYFVNNVVVATVLPGQSHSDAWRKMVSYGTGPCAGGQCAPRAA